MQVREVMTDRYQCCSPDTNLASAIEIMWNSHCAALPLVEDGKLTGIVTDRDIWIAFSTRECAARAMAVRDAGTTTPRTCGPEDDVCAAVEVMRTTGVRQIPVVDRTGRIQGILTLRDLAKSIDPEGGPPNGKTTGTLKAVDTHRSRMPAARVGEIAQLAVVGDHPEMYASGRSPVWPEATSAVSSRAKIPGNIADPIRDGDGVRHCQRHR